MSLLDLILCHQLLKNIQVLMDASVALMNQYAMISAQFPPLQTNPAPSNSSSPTTTATTPATTAAPTPATTTADEEIAKPAENAEKQQSNIDEEKTTVVSNDSDDGAGPSTSQKTSLIETVEIDGNIVTIEDIGRNDPSETGAAISEVRRRRLERFEAKGQES